MGEFLATPVGSFLRVVLGIVLGGLVVILTDDRGSGVTDVLDLEWWNAILGLAIGGGIPVLIAYLNKADPRFGNVPPTAETPPTNP